MIIELQLKELLKSENLNELKEIDSVGLVDLAIAIEDHFLIKFSPMEINKATFCDKSKLIHLIELKLK